MPIRNPVEWSLDHIRVTARGVRAASHALRHEDADTAAAPDIRRLTFADLGAALRLGLRDFGACRTDVAFLALIYPLAGIMLAQVAVGQGMWHLVFPLLSGFAIIGPVAACGLYELSRRREAGRDASMGDALNVVHAPAFGAICALGLILFALFGLWLWTASAIHATTLGPALPASLAAFTEQVLTTQAGWTMIALGIGAGALFAVAAFAISVVSFPLLLDRNVTLAAAIRTSFRAVRENPAVMLGWGVIVAALLALGALPALLGLIVVMPVLGHATWHLYRRTVA